MNSFTSNIGRGRAGCNTHAPIVICSSAEVLVEEIQQRVSMQSGIRCDSLISTCIPTLFFNLPIKIFAANLIAIQEAKLFFPLCLSLFNFSSNIQNEIHYFFHLSFFRSDQRI